jgi:hypothetical protein
VRRIFFFMALKSVLYHGRKCGRNILLRWGYYSTLLIIVVSLTLAFICKYSFMGNKLEEEESLAGR